MGQPIPGLPRGKDNRRSDAAARELPCRAGLSGLGEPRSEDRRTDLCDGREWQRDSVGRTVRTTTRNDSEELCVEHRRGAPAHVLLRVWTADSVNRSHADPRAAIAALSKRTALGATRDAADARRTKAVVS